MKKIMINLMLAGVFMITTMAGNNLFAEISSPYSPEGDKKAKKETSKSSKKATVTKTNIIIQDVSGEQTSEEKKASSEQNSDPNNPLNKFDCTKEGFDKE